MDKVFFNAQHSPIGAFASFTLGEKGPKGGFGHEIGKPADQNIYIGLESATQPGKFELLPFFGTADGSLANYTAADLERQTNLSRTFEDSEIKRNYTLTTDTWTAGDISFSIVSPVLSIPDPDVASDSDLQDVLLPAVFVEIDVDNSAGKHDRRVTFGFGSTDSQKDFALHYLRHRHGELDLLGGIGQGRNLALVPLNGKVSSRVGFDLEALLLPKEEPTTSLGGTALLVSSVPAGQKVCLRFAVCFHRDGIVTSGMDASYLYTRWWKSVRDVAKYALKHHERLVQLWKIPGSPLLTAPKLSQDQLFHLIHTIHSYYGSTQLLQLEDGKPFWIVNEGEYRMINTLDLVIDHAFYELALNPWTVRNNLDAYATTHSYYDDVKDPVNESNVLPGGVSFCHDMGVANHISPPQHSAYERPHLTDCFSYMTCEQLTNWTLVAAMYIAQTQDVDFVARRLPLLKDCLTSLANRDHPDTTKRRGVMQCDAARTGAGGAEITTYDSLDASLGQARENVYIGGKCWASYLALEKLLGDAGDQEAATLAREQAEKAAKTMVAVADPSTGLLPAIMGLSPPHPARIIPAIEALVYPRFTGREDALAEDGPYGAYVKALGVHLRAVIRPDVCLFDSGAWKLSSTSTNSWLSKTYLCQYVARAILGADEDPKADRAHVEWLTDVAKNNSYWAWSDQIIDHVAQGSKYYPRGVTSILWTMEKRK
ncbi:xylan 1,4-beta-xylosidase [Auriculariales sp. MPI-PUGE-AT-0066]|nr:xylan 1,4-beta-xylosidase [Auriculariales sp. MPI-PUGE-AT-0066]